MFVVGKYFSDRKDRIEADRDAMLRHYVQLHPEDFPPMGMYNALIKN